MQKGGICVNEKIFEFDNFTVIDKELDFSGSKQQYQIIKRCPCVIIVPEFDNNFVMINEFRPAIDKMILQFPTGRIEDYESPEEAAKRELKEEAGYEGVKIKKLGCFYTAAHFCDEKMYVFSIPDMKPTHQELTARELIGVELYKISTFENLLSQKLIIDAKSLVAYDMWRRMKG